MDEIRTLFHAATNEFIWAMKAISKFILPSREYFNEDFNAARKFINQFALFHRMKFNASLNKTIIHRAQNGLRTANME